MPQSSEEAANWNGINSAIFGRITLQQEQTAPDPENTINMAYISDHIISSSK